MWVTQNYCKVKRKKITGNSCPETSCNGNGPTAVTWTGTSAGRVVINYPAGYFVLASNGSFPSIPVSERLADGENIQVSHSFAGPAG
jgi:hypothetical protein